jgi:hypothetical protein
MILAAKSLALNPKDPPTVCHIFVKDVESASGKSINDPGMFYLKDPAKVRFSASKHAISPLCFSFPFDP